MNETDQAFKEIEHLQEIISRHESHVFALRGWMLTVVGALLAAYYTNNIVIDVIYMRWGLPLVSVIFLLIEMQHNNLVEVIATRVLILEQNIYKARKEGLLNWYDGPKIAECCRAGARRFLPVHRMTFILNLPFYIATVLIILVISFTMPQKITEPVASGSISIESIEK